MSVEMKPLLKMVVVRCEWLVVPPGGDFGMSIRHKHTVYCATHGIADAIRLVEANLGRNAGFNILAVHVEDSESSEVLIDPSYLRIEADNIVSARKKEMKEFKDRIDGLPEPMRTVMKKEIFHDG